MTVSPLEATFQLFMKILSRFEVTLAMTYCQCPEPWRYKESLGKYTATVYQMLCLESDEELYGVKHRWYLCLGPSYSPRPTHCKSHSGDG